VSANNEEWKNPPDNKPEVLAIPLVDLTKASANDENTLLGNRFLCRRGSCLVVGSTGTGKSTLIIQGGICWSVGRPFAGIIPRVPLRILYIQAENDEGDLCEMRDGVLENLKLNRAERAMLKQNFICAFESCRTGGNFIEKTLVPLVTEHSPDVVIIDPALSYIGGNAADQQVVGGFLRNQLNPVLQAHECAAILVHHTNKPNADRDGKQKSSNDWAYAGTGSAEWANWARAILILSAKKDDGIRELRIGKRFRLGWTDAAGKPAFTKLLRQSDEGCGLFYTELTPEESFTEAAKLSAEQKILRDDDLLPAPGLEIAKDYLIARIRERGICGRDRATTAVIWLVGEGYLEEKEVPRARKRPAIHLVGTNKKRNGIDMSVLPVENVIDMPIPDPGGLVLPELKRA
jgi:hypothetical protein